jgi:hypothetical protein
VSSFGYWEFHVRELETNKEKGRTARERGKGGGGGVACSSIFGRLLGGQREVGGGDGVGQGQPHSCSLGLNEEDNASLQRAPWLCRFSKEH